jgi:hypothetical protein
LGVAAPSKIGSKQVVGCPGLDKQVEVLEAAATISPPSAAHAAVSLIALQ